MLISPPLCLGRAGFGAECRGTVRTLACFRRSKDCHHSKPSGPQPHPRKCGIAITHMLRSGPVES